MKQQLNTNRVSAKPKRSLGQNFIINENFLSNLNKNISSDSETTIIEIGPGKGALTNYLIKKKFESLYLIEKDYELYVQLKNNFKENKKIKILNEDALNYNFMSFYNCNNVIIIGNLPFNVSTQLLFKWLEEKEWPPFYKKMILMFQKEVAERITSRHNHKNYSRISVASQARCKVKSIVTAPSSIFFPKPKVDGVILEFTPILKYKEIDFQLLLNVLKLSFSQRRKKIKNNLDKYIDILEKLGINQNLRAENITVDEYCKIVKML